MTNASNGIPRLSDHHFDILPIYDVIVIGSGYGGAIAASRCARAGQGVCILEKGKEWLPGEFPETFTELSKNVQVTIHGKKIHGQPHDLYSFHVGDGVKVLNGVGLGGGSLINANVSFEQKRVFFEKPQWPVNLSKDVENLYNIDAAHANAMLKPTIWPAASPYTEPSKMKAMEKAVEGISGVDIEDLGKFIEKIPLWVNFKDGKNPIGIEQPACNGCGNCCSGCNTGAKNTLNLNYLADAKAHGAHIFTKIDVLSVNRDSYTGLWLVRYKRDTVGNVKDQATKARFVFVAAGVMGTTKIMYRSKQDGLSVSDRLGHNFNSNGDLLGFCHGLKDEVNGVGLPKGESAKDQYKPENPGAAVTTVVDLRSEKLDGRDDLVLSDFAIPGALRNVIGVALDAENSAIALSRLFEKGFFETNEAASMHPLENTLTLISMSKTTKNGRIDFNDHEKDIILKHDAQSDDHNFAYAKARMEEVAVKLGGSFVPEPESSLKKGYFTCQPLGGCIMGETGEEGVVNHKGQVFIDNTSDVHDGLYIVDGSIIPCDVGVHPTFSICMLAERCLRLCAQDHSWHIDYELSDTIVDKIGQSFSKLKPGLIMTERMVGELKMKDSGESFFFDFILTVESLDVMKLIELDPEHSSKMSGSVTCPGLSKEPITVSEGVFKLLRNSTNQVDGKEMIYSMVLNTVEGQQYYFHGIKLIHKDSFGELGLRDTTILFITVFKGVDGNGETVGEGELFMKLADFAKQLTTISITNSKSFLERTRLMLKFCTFFAKSLWQTYVTLTCGSLLDPNAMPREKRPLKLSNATPIVYKVVTKDKVELRLTRYQGGSKGPIILIHGLGVASSLFLMDTVETNFVEYLIECKYDVWLFDWRTSVSLPWAAYTQFTVDDVAKYDFPAAVDKVLEVTKEKDVQLVIHCFGAIACMASILLGNLEGKVRCIITSQVGATPIGSCVNKFKSKGCFADMFSKIGGKSITAYVDKDSPWSEKTLNLMTRHFANTTTKIDQHCSSEVCHRITSLYGLLYEHKNLNVASHDILHELFGVASTKIFVHTALITRKQRLVSFDGKDVYLPGYTKRNRMQDSKFRRKMDLLNVPIMFFNGENNQCWDPENLVVMYNMAKEANPNQDYVYYEAKGYGHLDGFMGKRANIDIFPTLVSWLDNYAEDHLVKNTKVRNLVSNALNNEDNGASSSIRKTKSPDAAIVLKQAHEMDESKELFCESDDDDRKSVTGDGDGDGDTCDTVSEAYDLSDVQLGQLERLKTELDLMLKSTSKLLWERKVVTKSAFHSDPSSGYQPPKRTDAEQVLIKTFNFGENTQKREIYALSDLHLGVDWSKDIESRLLNFVAKMARIAEECVHSLILVGDVMEMCMTPVAVTPPTKEEFMTAWKADKVVTHFASAVRKMADEDRVNVFYVRGDHDRDMSQEMVKELFGDNVIFVPGCLVYRCEVESKQYTIRFEHGHNADLFSSYNLLSKNSTNEKPLSYYVTRALSSTEERFFSDTGDIIRNFTKKTLKYIPPIYCGSTFVDILSSGHFSKTFCRKLLQLAIGKELTGEESVIMDEEKWIRFSNIYKTKFLSEAISQHGSSNVYQMLKSSIGDLSFYVKECFEDVVVMGHSHKSIIKKMTTKGGNSIYANCGTWIDLCSSHSYVRIIPPTSREHGEVEVKFEEN